MANNAAFRVVAVSAALASVVIGSSTGCLHTRTQSQPTVSPVATSPTGDDGRSPASYLKVGDCIQELPQTGSNVTVVDCSKPHSVEVYGVFMLPDGDFPGEATVTDYKAKCPETIRQYMTPEEGTNPSNGRTIIKFPDENSWALGDRSVSCFIAFPAQRTGAFGAGKWIK